MASNELGRFLSVHRSRIRPEDVGMPTSGQRKVPGLRREEVAVLAGVSADYYTRLEQGRERHPSAQVLDAIARAFDMTDDARTYLFQLAGLAVDSGSRQQHDVVSPALRQLMDGLESAPAFVLNRTMDLLATNALAAALFTPFQDTANLVRMIFLDPAGRGFYLDWERAAQAAVAHLRMAAGHNSRDPRLRELVDAVSAGSPEFARLWHAHDVRGKTREAKNLVHPEVGPMNLTYQTFEVRESPGQQLVAYQAEPGSPSADALRLLGMLGATRRSEQPAD